MDKPFTEAYQLIENMAQNHISGVVSAPLSKSKKKSGMYEVRGLDHMNAKVDALTKKIDNLTNNLVAIVVALTPICEICGVQGHVTYDCQLLSKPSHDRAN